MKRLEDEIRDLLDYDSEETVALTFKTKARLTRNIVSTAEAFYAQFKSPQPDRERIIQQLYKYFPAAPATFGVFADELLSGESEQGKAVESLINSINLVADRLHYSNPEPAKGEEQASGDIRRDVLFIGKWLTKTEADNQYYTALENIAKKALTQTELPDITNNSQISNNEVVSDETIDKYFNTSPHNHIHPDRYRAEGAKAMRDGKIADNK